MNGNIDITINEIKDNEIIGYHIFPKTYNKNCTLICFGGSEGSSLHNFTKYLSGLGIEVFSFYYFGKPNLNQSLANIPLELFNDIYKKVIKLRNNNGHINLLGISKGAEFVANLASHYDNLIDNIILLAPTCYVFQGLQFQGYPQSSWTMNGIELEYLPFSNASMLQKNFINNFSGFYRARNKVISYRKYYDSIIKNSTNLEEARIKIELFSGKILTIYGMQDEFWDSHAMNEVLSIYNNRIVSLSFADGKHNMLKAFFNDFLEMNSESEVNNAKSTLQYIFNFVE